MANVAFIGLGNMGGPMARNLVKAGHGVRGFDLSEASIAKFVAAGGIAAKTVAEAAKGADAVVSMLPAGPQAVQTYLDSGLLDQVSKDAVLIDSSTIDAATARRIIAAAEAKGIKMVDAPVSGGVAAAEAGTLTFMVGGSDAAFAAAKPYLAHMGKAITHAGPAGNGQVAKICNNMLLGISMIGVAEAFKLGQRLGLDPQVLFDISSKASGQCWSMTSYCPVPGIVPAAPSNRDYQPGFAASMMLKDLKLAQDAASSVAADTPLGKAAGEIYDRFVDTGNGQLDFSAIIRAVG
jgi:3-hydroxyisobutyrate dehydrogenase